MWAARWNASISALRDLVTVLGVTGTVTLVALILGALLWFGYMVLRFGERGAGMFLPFLREGLIALRKEPAKAHPAIRLELHLQGFFAVILVVCLLACLLHALDPWVRAGSEVVFFDGFVTSLVVIIVLAGVSMGLALRLK